MCGEQLYYVHTRIHSSIPGETPVEPERGPPRSAEPLVRGSKGGLVGQVGAHRPHL